VSQPLHEILIATTTRGPRSVVGAFAQDFPGFGARADGHRGHAVCEKGKFVAVIVDEMMPGFTGHQCSRARQLLFAEGRAC